MRQRFFPKILIIALGSIFLPMLTVGGVQGQRPFPKITLENATQIVQLERYGNGVPRAMTFSPDGTRLAIATTLGVWMIDEDANAGEQCRVFLEDIGGRCRLYEDQDGAMSLAFSPDGKLIADGGDDNSVMVWEVGTGGAVARMESHLYPISAVAWSADGKWIASGDWSGVVRIWDTANWSEYRVLPTTEKIELIRFSPTGTVITASKANSSRCSTWDIASGAVISPFPCSGMEFITTMLSTSNGDHLAGYSADTGEIEIWDKDTLVTTLDGFYGELSGVFFAADGRVGASRLKPAYLWSLDGRPSDTPQPVLSPDGSRLATFGNDGVIHLKDAQSDDEIAALHGHIRAVTDVAFSPDGKLLISSSNDGTIQVWDATVTQDSGSLVTLTGHNGGVSNVAFNADGTLIASAGYDGTVRLWGIRS